MRNLMFMLLVVMLALPMSLQAQGCLSGGSEEGVNIVGFIQPQINFSPRPDADDRELTFSFNRARIGAVGNVPYDISYYFMMEFGPMKEESPYLLDAFITYTRFGEKAKISFGQFKQPFGLERNTSCSALNTVERSMVTDNLAMDRDMGVMLLGTLGGKFNYSVAVMNGVGLNQEDGNKGKDFVGRATYSPCSRVTVGTGFKFGNAESNDKDAVDPDDDKFTRFGLDFTAEYKDFMLQGEYIYGKDEGSSTTGGGCGEVATTVLGSFEKQGFHLTAMYNTKWNLQPVIKYELYDPDKEFEEDIMHIHTIGFNYFINEWTRIQVNYQRAIEEKVPADDNDALFIQMQVKFM
ncbi:MAG: OprO/OprP family phosphate-selective porin [Bacteroidales bacterium]|nr:OprO/OprP family phosphate-selective porin [Candidatus Latescibacterota bacterium]